MSLFTNKTKVKEPAEWASARQQLLGIGSTAPNFGVKEIAGMTGTEQTAQDLLSQYAENQSPEVQAALASLGEAGQYTNILDVPEYAALYKTGQGDINNQLNRIGRSLQLGGNTSSSTGAGVMTRSIGDLNKELLGSLSPYAAQERERRYQAPLTAAQLATSDTQSRLASVKEYGALPRELKQLSFDAQYMSDYLNQIAPYQYQVPVLSAVGGIGNTQITGGGLSDLGMLTQIGGSIAGGYAGGAGMAAGLAAFSDITLKENIVLIENAVEKINALSGYTFNYKKNPKGERDGGVMAQELEKVLPDAVVEVNGVKMVKYTAVIGLLVSAVKELAAKLETKQCQA